jgi:hypothetical protein
MSFLENKNLMFGLGAAILIVVGYLLFFNKSSTPDITTGSPTSADELLFINLAGELDPIVFNSTVLTDPRFVSLVDIRTAIIPENLGRTDPFAPLGK